MSGRRWAAAWFGAVVLTTASLVTPAMASATSWDPPGVGPRLCALEKRVDRRLGKLEMRVEALEVPTPAAGAASSSPTRCRRVAPHAVGRRVHRLEHRTERRVASLESGIQSLEGEMGDTVGPGGKPPLARPGATVPEEYPAIVRRARGLERNFRKRLRPVTWRLASLEVLESSGDGSLPDPGPGEPDPGPGDPPAPTLEILSVFCYSSHQTRDDPIMSPGQPGASHLNQFLGARTTSADSTYSSMVASETSCEFGPATAGHWFPALLDSSGQVVPPDITFAEYRVMGDDSVTAPPPGLKMVAGYPGTVVGTGRVNWQCKDIRGTTLPSIPNCPVTGRIFANVSFPPCWNGVNLDSTNHRSHMSYKTVLLSDGTRTCPSSHPVELPALAFEAVWNDLFTAATDEYRLSSDAPTQDAGGSLHASFWNTWNQSELERLVQTCLVDHNDVPESANDPGCQRIRG